MVVDTLLFFMISFVCGMVMIPIILHIIHVDTNVYAIFSVSVGVSIIIAVLLGVVLGIPIREIAATRSFMAR